MLCLGRKRGQRVVIGTPPNEIILTILETSTGSVRLGFESVGNVPIRREEVAPEKATQWQPAPVPGQGDPRKEVAS